MMDTKARKANRRTVAKHGVLTINPHSNYRVRYLGWCYAEVANGHGCTKAPVSRIVAENPSDEHKMDRIIVSITKYGLDVEFLEGTKSEYIYRFDIRYISYCSVNTEIGPRIFAWMYKKPKTRLICHAVVCANKTETRNLAMDLYAAFHVAYEEFRDQFGPGDLHEGSERSVSTQTTHVPIMRTRSLERGYEGKKLSQRCERNALREFHARSDYYPSPEFARKGVVVDSEVTSCLSGYSDSREIIRYSHATPDKPERLYIRPEGEEASTVSEDEGPEPDVSRAPKVTVVVDPRQFNHGLGPDNDTDEVVETTTVEVTTNGDAAHVKDRVEIDTDDDTSIEGENMYVVAAQVETIREENDEVKDDKKKAEPEMEEKQAEDEVDSESVELIKKMTVEDLQTAEEVPAVMSIETKSVNGEEDKEAEDDDEDAKDNGAEAEVNCEDVDDEKQSEAETIRSESRSQAKSVSASETKSRDDTNSVLSADGKLKLPVESEEERMTRFQNADEKSPSGKHDPFAPMLDEELFSDEFIDVQIWQHA